MNNKNVLVTGANGFIGQHVVRSLLDDGFHVRVMVHVFHQLHFFKQKEVDWREGDLTRVETIVGIADGIDIIYHLGGIPRNEVNRSWNEYVSVNIKGTENLLLEASSAGVNRFVFVSTMESVGYGNGAEPRSEIDTPHPENYYGKSKLEAEKLVMSDRWNMECVVARLPMVYGPGTFLIVPKLFGMVKNKIYPIFGSGEAKMEFCYVENAVQGIRLCGEQYNAAGEIFHISDQRSYKLIEVVRAVGNAMKCNVHFLHIPVWLAYGIALLFEGVSKILPFSPLVSKVTHKPLFSRETVRWTTSNVNTVSTEKIRNTLGYTPLVNLQKGCNITAKWLIGQGF